MKTTLDIHDGLMARAKTLAKRTHRPLRAVVEEGLQLALAQEETGTIYQLPDCRVGKAGNPDPLQMFSWQDLRDEIYFGSTST